MSLSDINALAFYVPVSIGKTECFIAQVLRIKKRDIVFKVNYLSLLTFRVTKVKKSVYAFTKLFTVKIIEAIP